MDGRNESAERENGAYGEITNKKRPRAGRPGHQEERRQRAQQEYASSPEGVLSELLLGLGCQLE